MSIEDFKTSFGFIIHKSKDKTLPYDAGDSAQRTLTYMLCKYYTEPDHRLENANEVERLCSLIELSNGEYVRYPADGHWWSRPGIMSRDNLTPLILCLVLYGKYNDFLISRKKRLFWKIVKRGGFLWNSRKIWPKPGDKWKLPDHIGITLFLQFFRNNIFLKPLFIVTDLFILLNAMAICLTGLIDKYEVGTDLNTQNMLFFSQMINCTPTSWISGGLYGLLRPNPCYGEITPKHTGKRIEGVAACSVWKVYYWNKERHPPLYESAKPLIRKYL